MKILTRINFLMDSHDNTQWASERHGKCELCKEIEFLGICLEMGLKTMEEAEKLKKKPKERRRKIADVKKEEYLALPKNMSEQDKADVLKIGIQTLFKLKKEWGFNRESGKGVTLGDYLALSGKLNDKQKAHKLGICRATLAKLKKEWGITKEIKEITKEEYLALPSNLPRNEKAKRLGVSDDVLVNRLKKWGLYKK